MNKIILYVGLAILLGTVTMIAPLALLNNDEPFSDNKYVLTVSEKENQTRGLNNNDGAFSLNSTSQDYLGPPPCEVETTGSDAFPEEPQVIGEVTSLDLTADLSPIALITVPSFLIALGVFVLLRRQVS